MRPGQRGEPPAGVWGPAVLPVQLLQSEPASLQLLILCPAFPGSAAVASEPSSFCLSPGFLTCLARSLRQFQPCPWHTQIHQLSKHANTQAWLTTAFVRRQKVTVILHLLLWGPHSHPKSPCSPSSAISQQKQPFCVLLVADEGILQGLFPLSYWKAALSQHLGTSQKPLPQCQCNYTCMKRQLEELCEAVLFQGTAFSSLSTQGCSAHKIAQWSQRLEILFLPYCLEEMSIIRYDSYYKIIIWTTKISKALNCSINMKQSRWEFSAKKYWGTAWVQSKDMEWRYVTHLGGKQSMEWLPRVCKWHFPQVPELNIIHRIV